MKKIKNTLAGRERMWIKMSINRLYQVIFHYKNLVKKFIAAGIMNLRFQIIQLRDFFYFFLVKTRLTFTLFCGAEQTITLK